MILTALKSKFFIKNVDNIKTKILILNKNNTPKLHKTHI